MGRVNHRKNRLRGGRLQILGDHGLALANLASLTLFANRVVAHAANPVVGMVVVPAVGAGDGVGAGGLAVLPGLMVDVVLGTLHAFFAVVFFSVVSSTLAAADLAGGMDLVSVLPAPCALDHVDLLRPPVHSALSVEEGDGPFGELRDSLLLVIGDGERHVGGGLVVVLSGAWSSGPVWAFHEDCVGEEGVCGTQFGLKVTLGNRDEVSMGGTGVLVSDSALVCDPSALGTFLMTTLDHLTALWNEVLGSVWPLQTTPRMVALAFSICASTESWVKYMERLKNWVHSAELARMFRLAQVRLISDTMTWMGMAVPLVGLSRCPIRSVYLLP